MTLRWSHSRRNSLRAKSPAVPALRPISGVTRPSVDSVRHHSLRRGFAWTLAGNVLFAGCQWGAIIGLARLASPERVGEYALTLAVTAPVFLGANLHLRSVQATDSRTLHSLGAFVGLRVLSTSAACFVSAVVAILLQSVSTTTQLAIVLMAFAKAADSLSDVAYGGLQRIERFETISRSMILRGALGLIALLGVFVFTKSVVWGIGGLAVAWWAVLFVVDRPVVRDVLADGNGRSICPSFEFAAMARLARLALPLGITSLLMSLVVNVPRYFIQGAGGESLLGIFSAISYLMVAGTMVLSALGQSATPRMARFFADDDRPGFARLVLRLSGFSAALGTAGVLFAWAFGEPFLRLVYGPEYAPYTTEFLAIMVAAVPGLVMSALGFAVTATRSFDPQPFALAVLVGVCVAACAYFVPEGGILGAAIAIGLTYTVGCLAFGGLLLRASRRRSAES